MTEPDSALESGVHDATAPGDSEVQPWRTRTRTRGTAQGEVSITGTAGGKLQSARAVAMSRWGTPIPEPAPVPDDELAGAGRKVAAFSHLRIITHTSPSMRAVWADFIRGYYTMRQEHNALWAIPYWAFGLPGLPVAAAAKVTFDSCIRPGRFAAFLAGVLLFFAGLWAAGVI